MLRGGRGVALFFIVCYSLLLMHYSYFPPEEEKRQADAPTFKAVIVYAHLNNSSIEFNKTLVILSSSFVINKNEYCLLNFPTLLFHKVSILYFFILFCFYCLFYVCFNRLLSTVTVTACRVFIISLFALLTQTLRVDTSQQPTVEECHLSILRFVNFFTFNVRIEY